MIADATLVFGYGEERCEIDEPLIKDVIADLDATGVLGLQPNPERRASVVPADPEPAFTPNLPPVGAVARSEAPTLAAQTPAMRAPTAIDARLVERERQLSERENEVAGREREVAEQRRVIAEQHRILRTAAPSPPVTAAAMPPVEGPAQNPVTASSWPPRREPLTPRPYRYIVPRREPRSFWKRLRDSLFGIEPVLEDSL